MSISSLSSDSSWSWYASSPMSSTAVAPETTSDTTPDTTDAQSAVSTTSADSTSEPSAMNQAMAQTLAQLGIPTSSDPQDSIAALMHGVFQATASTGSQGSPAVWYGDMASSLQGLAVSLGSGSDSSSSGQSTSELQSLMASLGGADSSSDASTNPTLTLQNFLQTLAGNLSTSPDGGAGTQAVGSLVNVSV